MPEYMIKGIPVTFPFEPYNVQRAYMEKVIECLENSTNGVLESPTGDVVVVFMFMFPLKLLIRIIFFSQELVKH